LERLLDLPDVPNSQLNDDLSAVEEKFTDFYIDTNGTPRSESDAIVNSDSATPTLDVPIQELFNVDQEPAIELTTPMIQDQDTKVLPDHSDLDDTKTLIVAMPTTDIPQEEPTRFYIDTEPSRTPIDSVQQTSVSPTTHLGVPMGSRQIEDDEEIIVYIAPHPRSGRTALAPVPDKTVPILPSTSILTGTTRTLSSLATASTPPPVAGSSTTSLTPASGSTILGIDDLSISTNTLTLNPTTHTLGPTTQAPTPSSLTRVPRLLPFLQSPFRPSLPHPHNVSASANTILPCPPYALV
jgi:hypothetical protein